MLASIYRWFSEGFDTPDLKDAKALPEEQKTSRIRPTTRISSAGPTIRLEVTQMGGHPLKRSRLL